MYALEDPCLENSKHNRFRSIALARKCGFSTAKGFYFEPGEITATNLAKIANVFANSQVLLWPMGDVYIGPKGKILKSFDIPLIIDIFKQCKCDVVLIEAAKPDYEVSAKLLDKNTLYLEYVYHSNFDNLIRGGLFTDSTIITKNDKNLPEFLRLIHNNFDKFVNLTNQFGECTIQFCTSDQNIIFYEAKKDTSFVRIENDIKIIQAPAESLSGKAVTIDKIDHSSKNILICEYPNIELYPLVDKAKAFLFRKGSILCHLALLLREKNIPAFVVGDKIDEILNKNVIIIPKKPYITYGKI